MGPDGAPTLTVIDTQSKRRRKVVGGFPAGSSPIALLAFAYDGRHIAVQTGAPDWSLHYVLWDRGASGRIIASSPNICPPSKSVSALSVSPDDATLCVSGRGLLRMLRCSEGALRPIALATKRDPSSATFSCHTWLPPSHSGGAASAPQKAAAAAASSAAPSRLLLGPAEGDVWLVVGPDFRRLLEPFPAGSAGPISSIALSSRGVLVGCAGGVLRLYEPSEDARQAFHPGPQFAVAVSESTPVGVGGAPSASSTALTLTGGGEVAAGTASGSNKSKKSAAPTAMVVEDRTPIITIVAGAGDEDVVLLCGSGEAYRFKLSSIDIAHKAAAARTPSPAGLGGLT